MKRILFTSMMLLCIVVIGSARTIYVSTTGDDSNDGAEATPYLNIQKAVDEAQPGDLIYLRGGTYMLTTRVKIEKAGTAEARISMFGYPGETVVIDGSNIAASSVNEFKQARCIYVNHFGDYWHFKDLEMCNAKDNGMKLEGSYNIVERCKFHDNNDTGLQLGMYKDFSIEETQSFPISGEPQFNPGYSYCKYNVVINCDSWYNYDATGYNGSDDGGDADGFACKLFPGPGTEFHGCRAWNNSDDNWDLYMVYHPVLIADCWNWNAGRDKDDIIRGNGNGFKMGGGGTAGGAAFSQSVGAHVLRNCVAFDNAGKGFDQNNAYEAMYLFNCVGWGNYYNFRFPTVFEYGTMYLRNCIGFNATATNHEFFSADKGGPMPNSTSCSWTTFDGVDPYKDGNKINGVKVWAQDHSADFKSFAAIDYLADREADGSLPENDFARLVDGSKFIDAGENIENFTPAATSPGGITLPNITILYNDEQADMGAFESGLSTTANVVLINGNADQYVYTGTAIVNTVYKWSGAATDVTVTDLPDGLTATKDADVKTVTISGIPTAEGTYSLVNVGGLNTINLTGEINISTVAPATLVVTSGKAAQEILYNDPIETTVITWGGGATGVEYSTLPAGLIADKDESAKTLTISGTPTEDGSFLVSSVGGMIGSVVNISGGVNREFPTKVLTGDWYTIQDEYASIPSDLVGVVSYESGSDMSNPTAWNPAYVESTGSAPSGCTEGGVNIERNGGSVTWVLPSLVELKTNLHFTGTRTLKIEYTVGSGATQTWTSASLSKQTMANWNVMLALGLEPTKKPVTIKLINTAGSGGIRLYDFYAKVYDVANAIEDVKIKKVTYPIYVSGSSLVVNGDIASLKVIGMAGRVVAASNQSQIVNLGGAPSGIYIVLITDRSGQTSTQKFVLTK